MMWTLEGTSGEKVLADWGVRECTFRRVSLDYDVLTLVLDGLDLVDDDPWAYGEQVVLRWREDAGPLKARKSWIKAVAWRDAAPAAATGRSQSRTYTFRGAWSLLDMPYKQNRRCWDGTAHALVDLWSSHVWACLDVPLMTRGVAGYMSTGEFIELVLDYAISQGAKIQKGTISKGIYLPIGELTNVSCGQMIRKMLELSPSTVGWWDYSTENEAGACPTFHCRPEWELTAVDVDLADVDAIHIRSREDLQVTRVVLEYEMSVTDGGKSYTRLVTQEAGDPAGDPSRCLTAVIPLQGPSTTRTEAELVCDPIMVLSDNLAERSEWVLKKCVKYGLPGIRIVDVIRPVDGVVLAELARWPYDLVSGQWSHLFGGECEDVEVSVGVEYEVLEMNEDAPDGWKVLDHKVEYETLKLKGITLPSGVYSAKTDYDSGEVPPADPGNGRTLAQMLMDDLGTLRWDGDVTLVGAELGAEAYMGKALNLTGGRAAWAGMRSVVQQVVEDVLQGSVTVIHGPPAHLTIDDWLGLLRLFALRRRWSAKTVATEGASTAAAAMQLPSDVGGMSSDGLTQSTTITTVGRGGTAITINGVTGTIDGLQVLTLQGAAAIIRLDAATGSIQMVDRANSRSVRLVLNDIPDGQSVLLQTTDVCENGAPAVKTVLRS